MNSADLKQKYNNASTGLFKDNSSGDIGANDARALVVDMADNYVNFETDGEKYIRQGTASGTDAYTVTVSSPGTVYASQNLFMVSFTNASTGAVTLNVNASGIKKVYSSPSTQATSGDIEAGKAYLLIYHVTLDGGAGGFLITSGGGGGGGTTLTQVLTADNNAGGLSIINIDGPTDAGDAANKGYVDSVVAVGVQDLTDVLGQGNDAGGTIITGLPAPSAGSDATNKTYVDSVSSGSTQLADYVTLTDAAPIAVDCNSLKEPKFYLELSNSRTLDITELRTDSVNLNYSVLFFWIKKKVAGDLLLTLDSSFTNIDIATQASVTAYNLSGADESDFFLTGVARGLASSCVIAWNLVAEASGGGGGGGVWGTITGTLSSQTDLQAAIDAKQATLVSATNIKTVNGSSILGSGDIDLIDDAIVNGEAKAPSQNAVFDALALKADTSAVVGVQDIFISASAMWPRLTNGCSYLTQSEVATSLFNIQTLDFDQTTQEFAQFQVRLPRKWNNGTITAAVYWTAASSSGGVVFSISGGAYSNDDALTVALGTAQTVTDTLLATNDLHITPTSSAITLAGTPADADFLAIQISRNPADGSDTLAADAKVLGVVLFLTTDAAIDA